VGRLPRSAALGELTRREMGALHRRLGQIDYVTDVPATGSQAVPGQSFIGPAGATYNPSQLTNIDSLIGVPVGSGGIGGGLLPSSTTAASGSGFTSAQEAALLAQGISTAGVLGKQAIIGSPTLTYNPATGQYTATGGATLPTSLGLSSTLTSLLSNPLVLLGIVGLVVFSMAGKK